jgi:erythromycin esterase
MYNVLQKPPNTHPGYGEIKLPRVPTDPEQYADALRSHLIPLASPRLASWLTDFLRGARLIGLGDGSHGTKEFFQVQEVITRQLIERHNLRLVFLEAPTPFCHYASEVLECNDPSKIDSVVMHACKFDTWSNSPILGLLRFIGAWNKEHPADRVKLRGIDPQLGGSLERLAQSLTSRTPHVDQIRSWCRDLNSLYVNSARQEPQVAPEVGVQRGARSQVQPADKNIRDQSRELLVRGTSLLSLVKMPDSLRYLIRSARLELAFQLHVIGRAPLDRSDTRDKYMAAAIRQELGTLRGEQRAAVLGHNAHVSYGPPGIFSNGMGCRLRTAYGEGGYKVIVSTTAGGTVTSRANDAARERQLFASEPAPRESLEGVLRLATETPSVIDIQSVAVDSCLSPLFSGLIAFRSMGCILYQKEFVTVRPTDQFDAVVFFPESNGIQ